MALWILKSREVAVLGRIIDADGVARVGRDGEGARDGIRERMGKLLEEARASLGRTRFWAPAREAMDQAACEGGSRAGGGRSRIWTHRRMPCLQ